MRIVLVHGFNVRDGGAKTVDRLAPYLHDAGHEVDIDDADYGPFSLWDVRFRKHKAVVRIARALESADAVVSHSNGANYEHKALRLLPPEPKKRVVRLSPAVDVNTGVAPCVNYGHVFHTRTDLAVWASRLLLFHPWGQQGRKGYLGNDRRVRNIDFSDIVKGHSDWFNDDNVEFVARAILRALEEKWTVKSHAH